MRIEHGKQAGFRRLAIRLRRATIRRVDRPRHYTPAERQALKVAFERFLQADIDEDHAEMPDQQQKTKKIAPRVQKLEPEHLLAGPGSTPLPPPRPEAQRVVGVALAKALKKARS